MHVDRWTFLTNHAHVLLSIAADPEIRLRDLAAQVGITERSAQSIVSDLIAEGYVTVRKIGRRNHYKVHAELPFRHPLQKHQQVKLLLRTLRGRKATAGPDPV